MKKKRIQVSSAKAKGRFLQQWTCAKISALLDLPYGPDEMIASREGSQKGTDIRLVGEAQKRFPFSVECKFRETWSVTDWMGQAKDNRKEGTDWLLVLKKSRIHPVVVLDADVFFRLLAKLEGKEVDDVAIGEDSELPSA